MRTHSVSGCLFFLLLALCTSLVGEPAWGGQIANPSLFSRATMQKVDLKGVRVWLGRPVQVTAQMGFHESWYWGQGESLSSFEHLMLQGVTSYHESSGQAESWWSLVHLTPYLARFPEGQLVTTYALDPDVHVPPIRVSGFQISTDGGEHWGRRYSLLMQHIPMVFVPKPNNSLMAIPSEMFEKTPGDEHEHNYTGPYYLFKNGGESMEVVPDGVRLVDLPWTAAINPEEKPPWTAAIPGVQPRDSWKPELNITGDALFMGGKLLATAYSMKVGEQAIYSVLVASEDGGYTWRYFSTVGSPDPSLIGQHSYEGPNESSMIRLADGDLMVVYRVGSGSNWKLRRVYSHDGGRTWTTPDVLPAWSVEPELVRTASGTIALSTGRPGIYLWLSTDPRGKDWQSINIIDHHNGSMTDPSARISSFAGKPSPYFTENTRWQTSSYTRMVEVAPNRLLLVYDRDPERPPVNGDDLSRVFVLPIEIERE